MFGARVVHEDKSIAFLAWDDECHRLALIKLPGVVRFAFPLAKLRRKVYGLNHLAFAFPSIADLLQKWEELTGNGIPPVWSINHGPTTSLYYDGIRLEFQVENFETARQTADYFGSKAFAQTRFASTSTRARCWPT